jgi:peptide deformylase
MDAKWNPDDTASRHHTVIINPKIKELWNQVDIDEGCLSIPGAFVRNTRYNNIVLEYTDMDNNVIEKEFMGLEAHVIQHEMEHLDGKLFIDDFKPMRKQLALNKHKKHMRLLRKLRR